MKRTGTAALLVALTLTLAVAGATSAAAPPLGANHVIRAGCGNTGGMYGYGKVVLWVSYLAFNDYDDATLPTPNYIRVIAKRQEKHDGVWVTVEQTVVQSAVYADGYDGIFRQESKLRYSFTSAVHPRTRIVMRGEYWDDLPGGDVRLKTVRRLTAAC